MTFLRCSGPLVEFALEGQLRVPASLFEEERACAGIIALDEVGRGCLAGPVVTCASVWSFEREPTPAARARALAPAWTKLVDDSKRLSERERETCVEALSRLLRVPLDVEECLERQRELLPNGISDLATPLQKARVFDPRFLEREARRRAREERKRAGAKAAGTDPQGSTNRKHEPESESPAACLDRVSVRSLRLHALELGVASAAEIDRDGIWNAVQVAMGRALLSLGGALPSALPYQSNLTLFDEPPTGEEERRAAAGMAPNTQPYFFESAPFALLVDGKLGVRVPRRAECLPQAACPQGDGLFLSVGLSSVVAKVARDRHMVRLARRHPEFGFDRHKGYGTDVHREAIARHPLTPEHRRSFLSNIACAPCSGTPSPRSGELDRPDTDALQAATPDRLQTERLQTERLPTERLQTERLPTDRLPSDPPATLFGGFAPFFEDVRY